MNVTELQAEYQSIFGEPMNSNSRQHLVRQIASRIQPQVEGRPPEESFQYAYRIAEQNRVGSLDISRSRVTS
jgi:hypothetical protein